MSDRGELIEVISSYGMYAPPEIVAEAIIDAGYVKESCCCGVCGI
jgi:hypothetical protein